MSCYAKLNICLCMNATDYKMCIRVLNQTARVAECVHAYERVIFVCDTRIRRVSDACHTHLALNLSPVCTVCICFTRQTTFNINKYLNVFERYFYTAC